MVVKNIFTPGVKPEIVVRINKLTADSKPVWGKMNVAQMLAHLQMPLGVADGSHILKRNLMGMILGPLIKRKLYNDTPYKRSLPTAPSFITVNSEREFEMEKAKLLDQIGRFTEANMVNDRHPFFGKMTNEQWGRGMWKHIDHHLQQFGV
jgi:hypothetical protein